MFKFKKLISIFSKEDSQVGKTVEDLPKVEAVDTYTVRWTSRYSEYSGGIRPEVEAVTSEHDARAFKKSLEAAFKLLRHSSGTRVYLEKNGKTL